MTAEPRHQRAPTARGSWRPALLVAIGSVLAVLVGLRDVGAASADQLVERLAAIHELRELRVNQRRSPFTDDDLRKAADGAVVTYVVPTPGDPNPTTWGASLVRLPIARIWSGLNDDLGQPGHTALEYTELLAGRPCQSGRRVLMFLPVPMVTDRWWISIRSENRDLHRASGGSVRELNWTSSSDPREVVTESGRKVIAQGIPIGFTKGSWFLVAIDDRSTFLEYYQWSDPGGKLPASMSNSFAARAIRKNFASMEQFAREGNPSCPIE